MPNVKHEIKPECNCCASTGIHDADDSDGTPERPWGLTFGSGELDEWGYWEIPCAECARRHEIEDGVPVNSYWPFVGQPTTQEIE